MSDDIEVDYKKYYLRKEISEKILSFTKNREVAVRYGDYFGKRPTSIDYFLEYKNYVIKGATSFHISEERWENPLILSTSLPKEELDKNRIGWDLILDLDGVDFVFSKIVGKIILDFFNKLNIKNVTLKFSGNKGFHIGIPWEAFSKEIIGIGKTSFLFPQAPRKIVSYLMYELKDEISKQILDYFNGNVERIAEKYGFETKDLLIIEKGKKILNFLKLIEIDTILITQRHLFRMPYSINEKSGLVSIPVKKENIMDFEKFLAKPEKVNPENYKEFEFLSYNEKYGKDADILLIKAYEDDFENKVSEEVIGLLNNNKNNLNFDLLNLEITTEIDYKDFPEVIKYILEHSFIDGKKRLLFVLLSFLHSINYSPQIIEKLIYEWNERQEKPLKEKYIETQMKWFIEKDNKRTPPNYDNDNYYLELGVPKEIIEKDKKKFKGKVAKNPLHYAYLFEQEKKRKEEQKEKNKSKNKVQNKNKTNNKNQK